MDVVYFLLLLGIVALLGFFAWLERKDWLCLAKALAFVLASALVLIIIFGSIMSLVVGVLNTIGPEELLFIIMIVTALLGVVAYWAFRLVFRKLKVRNLTISLTEYIVQWWLIFVTIYQITFDSVIKKTSEVPSAAALISDPKGVLIFILPSLISIWIAVVLYKVKTRQMG